MKSYPLLSFAVTIGTLVFGGPSLAQSDFSKGSIAIHGVILDSQDQEALGVLKRILLKGILSKLKAESPQQVDQIKQEGFTVGGREITGLIDKFDSGGVGEMNAGAQKATSTLAKKMGMTTQEMDQILGLFSGKTKADLSNVSVQEVVDVMAKSVLLNILKNDSLVGSETDGRGSEAGSGNASRPQFGNGVDPVAVGPDDPSYQDGDGIVDLRQITTIVEKAVAVGGSLAGMNREWSATVTEYENGEDDGDSRFDGSTEGLDVLERLAKNLQKIKNIGDAGSVPSTGIVYPAGSPGGVTPNFSKNSDVSRDMGAGEGGPAIDPEALHEEDSHLPRVKYKSDWAGSQSP